MHYECCSGSLCHSHSAEVITFCAAEKRALKREGFSWAGGCAHIKDPETEDYIYTTVKLLEIQVKVCVTKNPLLFFGVSCWLPLTSLKLKLQNFQIYLEIALNVYCRFQGVTFQPGSVCV